MLITVLPCKFHPGRVLVTPGTLRAIPEKELLAALLRHVNCDWGDVCSADQRANDRALKAGEHLVSKYHTSDNQNFLIITEADQSATTVMLPEEY